MEDYLPSFFFFFFFQYRSGSHHASPENKKRKKKGRKNQIHDHQSLPTRNVLLPASAPAGIVMSAALVGGALLYIKKSTPAETHPSKSAKSKAA